MRTSHVLMYIVSGVIVAYMSSQTRLVQENVGDLITFLKSFSKQEQMKLFSKEELSKHDGSEKDLGYSVYISIAGRVFDVSEESDIYGKGAELEFAAGRDISYMLATEDLTADALEGSISALSALEMWSLWTKLDYFENKFTQKGKLIGVFYDDDGIPAEGLKLVFERLTGNNDKLGGSLNIDGTTYPLCTMEWKPHEGGGFVKCKDESNLHSKSNQQLGNKPVFDVPVIYHLPGSEEICCTCIPKKDLHLPFFHGFRKFDPWKGSLPVVS